MRYAPTEYHDYSNLHFYLSKSCSLYLLISLLYFCGVEPVNFLNILLK